MHKSQAGFAHVIVLVLAFLLISGLGVLAWQNYNKIRSDNSDVIRKDGKNDTIPDSSGNEDDDSKNGTVAQADVSHDDEITVIKEFGDYYDTIGYESFGAELVVDYPKNWLITDASSVKPVNPKVNLYKISSPDKSIVIEYLATVTSGLGGLCASPTEDFEVVELNTAPIIGYSNARYGSHVIYDNKNDKYTYFAGAQRTDGIASVKVGDLTRMCDPFGIDSGASIMVDTKYEGYAMLVRLTIKLQNISNDSTYDEIKSEMKTSAFESAKQIIMSLRNRK